MDCKISFKERTAQAIIQLSKQPPVALEAARKQVAWLKKNSKTKHQKKSAMKDEDLLQDKRKKFEKLPKS